MSEPPAWVNEEPVPYSGMGDTGAAPSAPPRNKGNGMMASINNTSLPTILKVMRLGNFLVAAGMVILAVFTILTLPDWPEFVTAIYATIMGLVIVLFECQCGFLDESLRDNFGFLFSFRGRIVFMTFCALLNFGFGIGGYIVGISMILMGLFNAYVIFMHPEFVSNLGSSSDPTHGSKTAEQLASERASQYARDNPEQVASWAAQGANHAANNATADLSK